MRCLIAACLGVAVASFSTSAHALLDFTIQRQSDTVAIISATGTLDDLNRRYISLNGALAGNGGSDDETFSGNFTIGNVAPGLVYGRTGLPNFVLENVPLFPAGGSPSGSMTVTLSKDVASEVWAAVNTSGSVFAGINGNGGNLGTFTVTPIPAALPLFGSALVALGAVAWRRRRDPAQAIAR